MRWFLLLAICSAAMARGDDYTVFSATAETSPPKMLKTFLLTEAQKHFDHRRQEVAQLKTAEDVRARQTRLRKFFREALGDWPAKTPLNPVVVGRIPRPGYTVEKIILESRPQHHVTASLYLPEGKGPFPGVIMPIGHSNNGKAAEYVQRGSILLARNGIAVLAYDPIGQGERRQLLTSEGKPAAKGSTEEHSLTGIGALLIGRNTASYRVWDGIRCLDYLASRPEIDPKRLGCTGCSGGGTETSYLMALDERIVAAAPSCYITSLERLFAKLGPQDAEQNITGQVAAGLDHADYLLLHAPQPTLVCAATRDFFDIQGTHESFGEAKRLVGLLDATEKLELFESNTQHGYPQPHREATLKWMNCWLLQKEGDVEEADTPILPDAELQCTAAGQVLAELKGKSVFDLNAEQAAILRESRSDVKHAPELTNVVRRLLGIKQPQLVAQIEEQKAAMQFQKVIYKTEPGILLPALRKTAANSSAATILYLHPHGKAADRAQLNQLSTRKQSLLAVDLRGWGELSANPQGNPKSYFGPFSETFLALHLNRPLLGQRVADLLAIIAAHPDEKYEVVAVGPAGLIALHAAVLEPRIQSVTVERTLASWEMVTKSPVNYEQLEHVVPGALREYDLPTLVEQLAPRSVTIREPLDPQQQPLSAAEIKAVYGTLGKHVKLESGLWEGEAKPTLLQEQGAGEGPAWHPELGLFTSGDGHTNRRDREGKQSIFKADTGSNGLLFDREGRLVICQAVARRVVRLEKDGNLKVLAETFDGKRFNQPNDLTIDSQGRLYFSDPCYGDRSRMELADDAGRKIEGVYRIDLDGKVTRIITHEVDRPNGLVITPDDRYLFVADNNNNTVGGARKLWRFEMKKDGTVDFSTQKLIHDWKTTRGPDGMKLDAAGRLYVAAGLNQPNPPFETQSQPTAGVYVFAPEGKLLDFVSIPRDETTNCAFGGDDLHTLFITAGGSLWSIRTKTPGKPAWPTAK